MSGVFQNIAPPPHRPASECVLPLPLVRGEDTLAGRKGVGVNIFEDARHGSVLYICKYFVGCPILTSKSNFFIWFNIRLFPSSNK